MTALSCAPWKRGVKDMWRQRKNNNKMEKKKEKEKEKEKQHSGMRPDY
jgi:hypothetical protein